MRWLEQFFPSGVCGLCLRPMRDRFPWACPACLTGLPLLKGPQCARCGRLIAASGGGLCRFCRGAPPPFVWAQHLAVYDGQLQVHLHRLKFENRRTIARPLGSLLGMALRRRRVSPGAIVVSVPLHGRRLRERGYNQAALLADAAAAVLGRQHLGSVLVRRKETTEQARLSPAERQRNVRGAFLCVEPARVAGRDIILVDDVFTTGSTCTAAALALLRAGAASVAVACVAVAVSDYDLSPATYRTGTDPEGSSGQSSGSGAPLSRFSRVSRVGGSRVDVDELQTVRCAHPEGPHGPLL